MASLEEAILSKEDRAYLKSIRAQVLGHSHPDVVDHKTMVATSVIYGNSYLASIRKRGVDYLLSHYQTQPNDVFITSFPRSGTHWVMKICLEIMRNCALNFDALPPEYKNADYRFVPHIEPMVSKENGVNIFKSFIDRYSHKYQTLRFNFSHCPFHLFPANELNPKTKIIHIVRNVKDTAVSYYHLTSNYGMKASFDEFFAAFIDGAGFGGNWFDRFVEWYAVYKMGKYNILWLYYEDLKEHPMAEIQKIARFLLKDEGGKYLDERLVNDQENMERIVRNCSFKEQKRTAKRGWKEFVIRKGADNEWIKYFNAKQSQSVDKKIRFRFHRSDIKYYKE